MARYVFGTSSAGTQQNMTTTPGKTLASLTAATGATTLRRGWVYDVMFGADGTPADNAMVYLVSRQTTVGTGTSATPAPQDAGDAAALLVATVNHTIEPTITAGTRLVEVAVNQRATFRWVAAPGGELVVPATNVAGLGARAYSPAYASTVTANVHFWE
jgi:hypothetical protein